MSYVVIAENDESDWNDKTGELYHFPSKYRRLLQPGTLVVYYKGRQRKPIYKNTRLTKEAHYFGCGRIGTVQVDPESEKEDLYATIEDYTPFPVAVISKQASGFIEHVPASMKDNYWWNGVRPITKDIYDRILGKAGLSGEPEFNDLSQGEPASLESTYTEGGKKQVLGTVYERNPRLRQQAVAIHGYSCMACGFNFKETYGDWGEGFIHVHHLKPVSESGKTEVNPKTDLVVVCANCHAMIHRRRKQVLSLEDLDQLLRRKNL